MMMTRLPNAPEHLLCNQTPSPLGIDSPNPVLTWRCESCSAWQIQASDRQTDLAQDLGRSWDSGCQSAAQAEDGLPCLAIWSGAELQSATRYYWRVRVWDSNGLVSPWSSIAWFETGLLQPSDWAGTWIQAPRAMLANAAGIAPCFRRSFHLDGTCTAARLYLCAAGYYELTINGQKAGDGLLNPPFTAYDKRCLYSTIDITGLLEPGENVIGVVLGHGMYCVREPNAWDFDKAPWKDFPKFILQVDIMYGNQQSLSQYTGSNWCCKPGPIVANSLYAGEVYDARSELPGWNMPGYDDSEWEKAVICRSPGGVLSSMQMEPIRVTEMFRPVSITEIRPDTWLVDAGRSIAGWLRLRVRGQAGTVVRLAYGELLAADGSLDQSNISMHVKSAYFQTDQYILKGTGEEIWEPCFTYHGFQYVEITGYPGQPGLDDLTCCLVHTDLPEAGSFQCSDVLVNQIQAAARAATLNNYHGMPTDCPHREKNGWTGDALLSSEQTLFNFHAIRAYRKWLQDVVDSQRPSGQLPGIVPTGGWGFNWGSGPAWDSVIVFLPWNIYRFTGDPSILSLCWPAITRYLDFISKMDEDGTVDFGLGDWCPPRGGPEASPAPTRLSDTWFYHADLHLAGRIAAVLGDGTAAAQYAAKAAQIGQAFVDHFVDRQTGLVSGDCQTSYALALQHDLIQGALRSKVFTRLVDAVERSGRHIDCGIIGTAYVLEALASGGRMDLAWDMATQRDFPGWGHWISQGATTLWEMWDGQESRNHHMFSSVSAFFYKYVAGIRPSDTEPGFRMIHFAPQPVRGLSHAEAWHETPAGLAGIAWSRQGEESLMVRLTIPAGSQAVLEVPAGYAVTDPASGQPAGKKAAYLFAAGDHQVTVAALNPVKD